MSSRALLPPCTTVSAYRRPSEFCPPINPECAYELLHGFAVPDVRRHVSRRRPLRVRSVPRAARGHVRLRRDCGGGDTGRHRGTPAELVALPRAAADYGRAADRVPLGMHAA